MSEVVSRLETENNPSLLKAWQIHLQNFMDHLNNIYWSHPDREIIPHPHNVEGGPVYAPIRRSHEQIVKNMADFAEMQTNFERIRGVWNTPEDWFVQHWTSQ